MLSPEVRCALPLTPRLIVRHTGLTGVLEGRALVCPLGGGDL